MPGSVLLIISYVLLAIFIIAFLVRSIRLALLPMHLRWELSPVAHEKGKVKYGGSYLEEPKFWEKKREKSLVTELTYMVLEITFLKALWEHNRKLWWFSWPLHFGLYLFVGALGLTLVGGILGLLGVEGLPTGVYGTGTSVVAGIAYCLGGFGASGLFIFRLTDKRLKAFSTRSTLVNLALLMTMFGTGIWALLLPNGYAPAAMGFVGSLFSADFASETPTALAVHGLVLCVFLAWLPFTPMMHMVAKYFTYHKVRWDDEPMTAGSRMEKEVGKLLSQPVTWSAPHLKADGKKNWVDIATAEVDK